MTKKRMKLMSNAKLHNDHHVFIQTRISGFYTFRCVCQTLPLCLRLIQPGVFLGLGMGGGGYGKISGPSLQKSVINNFYASLTKEVVKFALALQVLAARPGASVNSHTNITVYCLCEFKWPHIRVVSTLFLSVVS